ncbi:MAG: TrkA C-terminal domain-containing protein [Candidatus Euphemobacter frigidus]|nr:TrkA C-terminal domain-containing protein [Candidatus Euphemobacter frigidus]MDP8275017.1 TrkA C-terminal domain-containing protein [Candidatus Euphemobacter frigidus]
MNLLLLIATLIVSVVAVRIGAVAFNLTGLEWSTAKFQALSCFSGTGFTTREAELVIASPRRRRIATYLIILGHAGFVAMIATFANSLRPNIYLTKFTIPFLRSMSPSQLLPWVNLLVIVLAVYTVFKISTSTKFARKLTKALRTHLIKKEIFEPVAFEELLLAPGGYGVSYIEITEDNPVINKTLVEAHLRRSDILVLAVERENQTIPNPPADTKVILGDKLMCFGKLATMRKQVYTLLK